LLSCFEDACDVNIFRRNPVLGAEWLELDYIKIALNYDSVIDEPFAILLISRVGFSKILLRIWASLK
jgi:hypothetical protein